MCIQIWATTERILKPFRTINRPIVVDRSAAELVLVEMVEGGRPEIREPHVGATQCTEVRWFIRGGGPLLEGVPIRSCIDSYRSDMLADGISVKTRAGHGEGVFVKVRKAIHSEVAIGDLRGRPETWARWNVGALPSTAAAVHVDKTITRRKGVEIAQLRVRDEEWWSIAVRLRGPEPLILPSEIDAHICRHSALAFCGSYAAWLVLHANRSGPPNGAGRRRMRFASSRVTALGRQRP